MDLLEVVLAVLGYAAVGADHLLHAADVGATKQIHRRRGDDLVERLRVLRIVEDPEEHPGVEIHDAAGDGSFHLRHYLATRVVDLSHGSSPDEWLM